MYSTPCGLWEAHEDTLDPRSRGHKAEFGTAVYDQVEFDVSGAAEGLLVALVVGVGYGVASG